MTAGAISGEVDTGFPSEYAAKPSKVEWRDVHKSFGSNHVLRGVNLTVAPSESMAIIGGSGSGKSVTIKCVLGLLTPDKGQILIDGTRIDTLWGRKRAAVMDTFGMLFQGAALFDSLPVWQNVAFRLLRSKPRQEARALAIEKLAQVGLDADTADLFPGELSGGMQKRVGLARAIAADPEIIFFDEPTTGLDPIMADMINDLIRDLAGKSGTTALTITHDMASVRKIADKVALIHDGVIQWSGPTADLDRADNAYIDQFIHGREDGPIEAVR